MRDLTTHGELRGVRSADSEPLSYPDRHTRERALRDPRSDILKLVHKHAKLNRDRKKKRVKITYYANFTANRV